MANIIITCTSFPKRINKLASTINSIIYADYLPNRLVINLSKVEFPKLELDLPVELVNIVNEFDWVEINWVEHNTKVYKKLFPTVDRFPNDAIMTIDDDFIYPPDMLSQFINTFNANNGEFNITGSRQLYEDYKPLGVYTLYKPGVLSDYRYYMNFNDLQLNRDDEFIYAFLSSKSEHFTPVTLDADYPMNQVNNESSYPHYSGDLIQYYKTVIPRYCEITSKLKSRVFTSVHGSSEKSVIDLDYFDFKW